MQMLTRARFLGLGTTVLLGSAAAPAAARAALPVPAPQGDDEGFLQFGALAERAALAFYRRALKMPGAWTAAEHRRLRAAAARKVLHVQRLTAALGADAPSASDYAVDLPKSAFGTRAGALKLGRRLEALLIGVYVDGVAYAADPATRLLLGRLLAGDAQHLALVRQLAGLPPRAGLPDPLDVEAAGAQLDGFRQANGYPTV
jgi:Ferritin-like domain